MEAAILRALVLAAAVLLGVEAVWLDLPPTGTKCVSEEIQPNAVVHADYALMYEPHPTVHPTVAVKVGIHPSAAEEFVTIRTLTRRVNAASKPKISL